MEEIIRIIATSVIVLVFILDLGLIIRQKVQGYKLNKIDLICFLSIFVLLLITTVINYFITKGML